MIILRSSGLILASAMLLAGCGAEQVDDNAVPAETGAEPAAGMEGTDMPEMSGMQGEMMQEMTMHMEMMAGAPGDSLEDMIPAHRQMAANMLAQMTREMREMSMTTDAGWNATVDSVRQDLTRMSNMSAAELEAMMPAHRNRMMRLMDMHHSMMSNMQM